jgi:HD-GYP domain-containing protein (c-di-GMP phosphodiesterase class II)
MSLDTPSTTDTIAAETAIVDGLLHLVRQRDAYMADHLEAVGLLAARIAQALELGPDAVARVRMAGRLHDIGMLSVPLQILEKHAPLVESERRKLQTHSDRGGSSAGAFPQLQHYRSIVRAHHERIDGTGYPDGLIGLEIPYQARIIAVADAFHAMTVPRDYADIKAPAAAIAELYAGSGRQFDAEYVVAFAGIMEHGSHALRSA